MRTVSANAASKPTFSVLIRRRFCERFPLAAVKCTDYRARGFGRDQYTDKPKIVSIIGIPALIM
jgi:hypothetical protein